MLFRFNPNTGNMRELGVFHPRGWTVYRVDTIAIRADGVICLDECSWISHLIRTREFKYIPVIGAQRCREPHGDWRLASRMAE